MRDQRAPVINGYDFSGLVNRYSFQCEPYYEEGGNGGTFLDGSTVRDVLAVKERLSWTLNSLTAAQYAEMSAAFNSGETPDLAVVLFKDPALNAVRKAAFHVVTRPPFLFSKEEPYYCTKAGAALILEESYPIERYVLTPPTQTDYAVGDSFAFAATGMTVSAYDTADTPTVITSQCVFVPADGSEVGSVGSVNVKVSYSGVEIGTFSVNVTELTVVASDDWWTLYNNGRTHVFCTGDMPNFSGSQRAPWTRKNTPVRIAIISDSVTSIGAYAFYNCGSLRSVTISDNVTSIGTNAFYDCSALINVTIPDSVITIGNNAFYNCSSLTNVTIGNGVTSIGEGAFYGCTSMTNVTIGNSVTSIGDNAFYNCSMTSVTIPGSVTSIGTNVFHGCASLTNVTIPDSVTSIGDFIFSTCAALTSATIGNGVTNIADGTFFYCENLKSVTIPDSVTGIGDYAFARCVALADVYYSGTQAQWEAITIGTDNSWLSRATMHYSSAPS